MAWASQPLEARQLVAERIVLSGHVQGQGLRPAVCRIATGLALCGSVCNTSDGVEILASGTAEQLDQFAKQLSAVLRAEVNRRRVSINASRAEQGFAILPSDCSG